MKECWPNLYINLHNQLKNHFYLEKLGKTITLYILEKEVG